MKLIEHVFQLRNNDEIWALMHNFRKHFSSLMFFALLMMSFAFYVPNHAQPCDKKFTWLNDDIFHMKVPSFVCSQKIRKNDQEEIFTSSVKLTKQFLLVMTKKQNSEKKFSLAIYKTDFSYSHFHIRFHPKVIYTDSCSDVIRMAVFVVWIVHIFI